MSVDATIAKIQRHQTDSMRRYPSQSDLPGFDWLPRVSETSLYKERRNPHLDEPKKPMEEYLPEHKGQMYLRFAS